MEVILILVIIFLIITILINAEADIEAAQQPIPNSLTHYATAKSR